MRLKQNKADSIFSLEKLPELLPSLRTVPQIIVQNLCFIKPVFWSFKEKIEQGLLIVHQELAEELIEIFINLAQHRFPIEQMRPIHEFANCDRASMAANNTISFHYRSVTGQAGIFSQHSYGRAVDLNPRLNPYVDCTQALIFPSNGEAFLNRNQEERGLIRADSYIVQLFRDYGWDWGGGWLDIQDYQHFEKRAQGEKRNPLGYPQK